MILSRGISNGAPPEPRTRIGNNPTLLFSWWCTCFSLAIIAVRLGGRYVRTERFFREDIIMAMSIIPLMIRMGFVHIVLTHGTNNVVTEGRTLLITEIESREIGAKYVLAARIFFAMYIWVAKYTVSEFLKRLTERFWKKSYETGLRAIRGFLAFTFICVVIATLSECQPFSHYWQVVPDPGPRCRQGYAHLIVMGVTDIVTDILLVVFPIPIIVRSAMGLKRKFDLIMLFSLSVILIGITAARVPNVIGNLGRQQYRTVFASGEILAATAVSNAVILGSFLRDRGVKKVKKYKFGSTVDSIERRTSFVRPTLLTAHHWGSDEDLIRDVGMRLDPALRANRRSYPRPAPVAMPAVPEGETGFITDNWRFPGQNGDEIRDSEESDLKIMPVDPNPSPTDIRGLSSRRAISFFDVGGLLEDGRSSTLVPSPTSTTSAQDWANVPRRGSRAILQDLGGLLSQNTYTGPRRAPRSEPINEESYEMETRGPRAITITPSVQNGGATLEHAGTGPSLQDVGGLLGKEAATVRSSLGLDGTRTAANSPSTARPSVQLSLPTPVQQQPLSRKMSDTPSLVDAGGLLNDNQNQKPP